MRPTSPEGPRQSRWDQRYQSEGDGAFSWTELADSLSLNWIVDTVGVDARIADVGAGRSLLIDQLLARGFEHLSHIEWSGQASVDVRARLGSSAEAVDWVVGDVCTWRPEVPIDLWHDRAVFHFQTTESEIQHYLRALDDAVVSNGYALVATFHLDGPNQCSGFPVVRYDAESLLAAFHQWTHSTWALAREEIHAHQTPAGQIQLFQYALLRKLSSAKNR